MSILACSSAERRAEGQEPARGLTTAEPGLLGPFGMGSWRLGAGQRCMATQCTCQLELWVAVASGRRRSGSFLLSCGAQRGPGSTSCCSQCPNPVCTPCSSRGVSLGAAWKWTHPGWAEGKSLGETPHELLLLSPASRLSALQHDGVWLQLNASADPW